MKSVLKITLGIILAFTVLIVGCVAIIGGRVDETADKVQEISDKASITQAEFQSVKVGPRGDTRGRIMSRFGEPQSGLESQTAEGLGCISYNREGKLTSFYQFCIDPETDRVQTKLSL